MTHMKAVQVEQAGGALRLVERERPTPGPGQALVKVQACGVCHSDVFTKEGLWPGLAFPRVPGHEIAGVIEAVGAGAGPWAPGQRVGVGWHGGHCSRCDNCRRGNFVMCAQSEVPGISYDGGYAEYMVAPVEALARIPDDLSDVEAAPLLCAGITTFNALRNSGAGPGDLVAVLGIGGLGHLGVQFATRMGFRTVAIARGADKADLARQLGATHYIDSTAENIGEVLQSLGGARVILSTVTSGQAIGAALPGLGPEGKMLVVGVADAPVEVNTMQFLMQRQSLQGWPSGSSIDSQDTMAFSALTGVRPVVEEFPLERAAEAYDRMMSGKARFRVVLTMS